MIVRREIREINLGAKYRNEPHNCMYGMRCHCRPDIIVISDHEILVIHRSFNPEHALFIHIALDLFYFLN